MTITPTKNVIQVNQNMHIAATKVANTISRIDMQDLAAKEIAKEEKKDVEEVRAMEKSYRINEDLEHDKQQARDELYREKRKKEKRDEDEFLSKEKSFHLDIKA